MSDNDVTRRKSHIMTERFDRSGGIPGQAPWETEYWETWRNQGYDIDALRGLPRSAEIFVGQHDGKAANAISLPGTNLSPLGMQERSSDKGHDLATFGRDIYVPTTTP